MSKILLIGSDPEMFAKQQDIITSVAGHLGCSKKEKLDLGGIRIQEDNVLIEFDNDPCSSFDEFNLSIKRGIDECNKILNPLGMEVAPNISSHIFTQQQVNTFNPSAFEFGCEADFNALIGQKNPKPAAADAGLRSAGGHLHFGQECIDLTNPDNQKIMAVMCDYMHGLCSVILDSDNRRRELYGKAGATRFKEYGIEYRTLSNFWIFDEANRRWAWDQGNKAFNHVKDGTWQDLLSMIDPHEVQRVINEGDKVMAEQYIKLAEIA